MKKITFDTNIYLHNVNIISEEKYDSYERVSLLPVISELDNIKVTSAKADLKHKGRIATRVMKEFVDCGVMTPIVLDSNLDISSMNKYEIVDDLIITLCKSHNITLVTMDYNVYLKCKHVGVEAILEDSHVKEINLSTVYKGRKSVYTDAETISKVYEKKYIDIEDVHGIGDVYENQGITLVSYENDKHRVLTKCVNGKLVKLNFDNNKTYWGATALSEEQKYAMSFLDDDSIRIVSLTGEAGTSKTFLSFAVGLERNVNYFGNGKLYIARPPVSLSRKLALGFKKGTTLDKAIGSLGSYSTNLEKLATLSGRGKGKGGKVDGQKMLTDMLEQGMIHYLNLEDILGMSFSDDDYIIVDEAELLTKDEMKAILTRGGKVVVLGDCEQGGDSKVDYLDSGLLHLVEVGKNSPMIAHVTLEEVYRSEIVKEINDIW